MLRLLFWHWTKIEFCASIIYMYSHMYFSKHWLNMASVQNTGIRHVGRETGDTKMNKTWILS